MKRRGAWAEPPRASKFASPGLLRFNEVQKLRPRARVAPEGAEHAGSDHPAARRLDPAHLQAEMPRFDDHADASGGNRLVQRLGDLVGELLLDLQPLREGLDQARDLADPGELALGQVAAV